jgi:hypothetical protein
MEEWLTLKPSAVQNSAMARYPMSGSLSSGRGDSIPPGKAVGSIRLEREDESMSLRPFVLLGTVEHWTQLDGLDPDQLDLINGVETTINGVETSINLFLGSGGFEFSPEVF